MKIDLYNLIHIANIIYGVCRPSRLISYSGSLGYYGTSMWIGVDKLNNRDFGLISEAVKIYYEN